MQWLSIIKVFELEVSVLKIAGQMNLVYNTVYRAVQTIRYAIPSHTEDSEGLLSGEIELDEAYFGGRRKGNRVRRGSIVYTDKFRSYDSLMFCGYRHLKVDHNRRFASGKLYINGLEGFWSWAKERLIKYHRVSKVNFPLYLKELEFRYNHRHTDMFEKAADHLCDLVPKLE